MHPFVYILLQTKSKLKYLSRLVFYKNSAK